MSQVRDEYLIEHLHLLLAPVTLDGSECCVILKRLVAAVCEANDDGLRVAAAVDEAMRAMGALTMGLVPRDAVDNAICIIVEKLP